MERREKYIADTGDGLYRRSLYTFWKRTCPPPGLSAFDAPDRETCVIRRARTNTPMQALALLNDPTYIEAARKLAERVLEAGAKDETRFAFAWKVVLSRDPTADDTKVVQSINFDNAQKYYIRTDGSIFDQFVGQETSIASATTTTNNGNVTTTSKQLSWPVSLSYDFKASADGSYQQFSQVHQSFMENVLTKLNGTPTYSSSYSDTVAPMDTLLVDPAGNGSP